MKIEYPWNKDSKEYKDFTDTRSYDGIKVNRMGHVIGKSGRVLKATITEDNAISVSYRDEESNLKCRSYQRLVYKAWNPDFDIENQDLVVVSKDRNPFDRDPFALEVITREQHMEELKDRRTIYKSDSRLLVRQLWEDVKDHWTMKKFAEELGMNYKTVFRIITEETDGRDN